MVGELEVSAYYGYLVLKVFFVYFEREVVELVGFYCFCLFMKYAFLLKFFLKGN